MEHDTFTVTHWSQTCTEDAATDTLTRPAFEMLVRGLADASADMTYMEVIRALGSGQTVYSGRRAWQLLPR